MSQRTRDAKPLGGRSVARPEDHGRSGFKNKERTVRLHLIPFFGATPLSEISRRLIDQFKVKLRTPTGEHAISRRTRNATQPRVSSRRKGGPNTFVWTGSLNSGASSDATCKSWEPDSPLDHGLLGKLGEASSKWLNDQEGPCGLPAHLYCVQNGS